MTIQVKNAAGETVEISTIDDLLAIAATATGQAAIVEAIVALGADMPKGQATEAKQDALLAKDFATQTTLAAILAKIIAGPSTEAKQDAANVLLTALKTQIVLAGGENHIGSVGGNTSYVDVTLTVAAALYASGNVLSDRVAIPNAMRVNDGTGILQSIAILDEADQGPAFDLVFLSADVTIGTVNTAVSITDANARNVLGIINVAASDFTDLGVNRVATKPGVGLVVKPVSGSRTIYVAAVSRGAPTFAAATDIKLRLGFLQD